MFYVVFELCNKGVAQCNKLLRPSKLVLFHEFEVIGFIIIMLMSSDVNNSVGKPRPPVPPRPNKSVLDEAVLKYKSKPSVETPEGVVSVTKNNGPSFNNISNFNRLAQNAHQIRTDLGQHVHESDPIFRQNGQRHPTVLLINELKTVRPSGPKRENFSNSNFQSGTLSPSPTKIKHSNWYQVEEESGRPVKYSSCQIILDDSCASSPINQRPKAVSMSSLQGLPPLPKSLSGVNLLENVKVTSQVPVASETLRTTKSHQQKIPLTSPPPPPPSEPKKQSLLHPRKVTTLETQLAMLRKEMVSGLACEVHAISIGKNG